MARKKKPSTPKPISATTHNDKRANIPTEELRDFFADDEKNPTMLRYPRDPSLDPQLVWKGKDEQDGEDLVVPAVPIYIQEKIHPQVIVEDVRAQSKKDEPQQVDMFSDFNGIEFEDLIEFYQHQQNWTNRLILGDSLQVMTSLAEKEGLKGQVQMVFLDPPYGIKFRSNWQVSTRKRNVEGKPEDVTRQPEQIKAFRDTWELGIHSYLSYLRDRLMLTRELLTESGSVFIQIGDENVHLVRNLLDEIFGDENFISQITFRKKLMPLGAKTLENMSDYLVWYAKNKDTVKYHQLYYPTVPNPKARWTGVQLEDRSRRVISASERKNLNNLPKGATVFTTVPQIAPSYSEASVYDFKFEGNVYQPSLGSSWVTTKEKMLRLSKADRLIVESEHPRYLLLHSDFGHSKITNPWNDTAPASGKIYAVQTNNKVVERCMLMTTDPGDLIIDPTCGSGTTAYVAEEWGRRWITIDTSRVSLTLARTRLMAARYPYYLLADSPDGLKKQVEVRGVLPDIQSKTAHNHDIRKGFVYKQAPHITLRYVANNEEVDTIHAKYQAQIEPILQDFESFENFRNLPEWELPRETEEDAPQKLKDLLAKYWSLCRQRQNEIDSSITHNSVSETLYDKPYQDKKKLRVTGPFTVESLSPHRVLALDEPRPASESDAENASIDFSGMILENLKKAGVQNTVKNERLKFDRLENYAGEWLQAEGEYTEKDGSVKRIAVAIGPEHGTVGPGLVKDAAKEAVRGVGFDLLIVCGFAFDPHVAEEARRYGGLTVLPVRMNPDLAMGDTLLKKTGSGNLFMVFGEPDVEISTTDENQLIVEIHGLDIYDPTTGQIRSSSTDDIACWFIDTAYNEESFFVRHAYFTGADKPYDKLKRTLRSEIDEEAWESLYKTSSRPFGKPESGKIAVKVINHYGDEVLKVYEV
jgi:adenine-specific DNA-methyltransferase